MASPLYELALGWRYLQRRSTGRAPIYAARLALVGLLVGLGLLFYGHVVGGAAFLVPSALVLLFALVLRYCSIFTTVSIVGVSLGVAALIVVMSVMSGFQQAFRQKVLGVNAHIVVLKYGRDFSEYRDVLKTVLAEPHVAAAAPFIFEEMMLSSGRGTSGTLVKGIDTKVAGNVIDLADKILPPGKISDLDDEGGPDTPKPMIIGRELAKKLKAKVGDQLRLVVTNDLVASDQPSGAGQAAARTYRVVGIFYAGFDEYDRHLAYVSLKDAQSLLGGNDYVTGVEMRLDDMDRAPGVAKDILAKLGGSPFRAIDWEDLNHNLFEAVHTQKLVLSIFLTIIVVVASFNVIAALSVLVVDKTREVAILKSMGLSPWGAARVFVVSGMSIGIVGTTLGVVLGLLLCAVVSRFGYALDPHVYLIDHLPVRIGGFEVGFTVLVTFAICILATLYPSYRASALEPVDGLRQE